MSDDITFPARTWKVKIPVNLFLFSDFNRSANKLGSKAENASSDGANTVNGPLLLRVSTKSAAVTAFTNVLKEPAATAVSTISGLCPSAFKIPTNDKNDILENALENINEI